MGLAGLLLPKSGRGPFSPLSPYLFRLMSSFWFCVAALYCCFFFLCHLSQSNRSASSRVSLLKIINSNAGKATARENVPPPPLPHPRNTSVFSVYGIVKAGFWCGAHWPHGACVGPFRRHIHACSMKLARATAVYERPLPRGGTAPNAAVVTLA